jgi:hypothetical protein
MWATMNRRPPSQPYLTCLLHHAPPAPRPCHRSPHCSHALSPAPCPCIASHTTLAHNCQSLCATTYPCSRAVSRTASTRGCGTFTSPLCQHNIAYSKLIPPSSPVIGSQHHIIAIFGWDRYLIAEIVILAPKLSRKAQISPWIIKTSNSALIFFNLQLNLIPCDQLGMQNV